VPNVHDTEPLPAARQDRGQIDTHVLTLFDAAGKA
jgi:hypothetical protein